MLSNFLTPYLTPTRSTQFAQFSVEYGSLKLWNQKWTVLRVIARYIAGKKFHTAKRKPKFLGDFYHMIA